MRQRADHDTPRTFGYLDESGTAERYFGVGLLRHGPGVTGATDARLNARLGDLREAHGFARRADLAWKKVPSKEGQYLDGYLRLLDEFFRYPSMSFHALVVDTHEYPLDSRRFFRGRRDAGMDWFAFHLLRQRVFDGPSRHIYLRFDRRSRPAEVTTRDLAERLRKEAGLHTLAPRVTLRSVTGKRHPPLQLCDLLLGATMSCFNVRPTSLGRVRVVEALESWLGCPLTEPTGASSRFSVWTFKSRSESPA